LALNSKKKDHNTIEGLLTTHPNIFGDELVKSSEWQNYKNLKHTVASVLSAWEQSSLLNWKRIIIRKYQLSTETKYLYTRERILFLFCRNHSPLLQKIPLEIIKLICSYLPITLHGCHRFGFQTYSTGKWSWDCDYHYLVLDPDTHTFEYVYQNEGANWSYLGMKQTKKFGKWKINSVNMQQNSVKVKFHDVECIISARSEFQGNIEQKPPSKSYVKKATITKDPQNGGIKVILNEISIELPELSNWHFKRILAGNHECINTVLSK